MKTLVVFYSRTGNTRDIARRIAAAMDADIEEIRDRTDRAGIVGYLRAGRDAWFERRTELAPLGHDPAAYDLVIVGTPTWNRAVSTPVRTFLQDQRPRLPRVAFFCTCGGMGSSRVLRQMETLAGSAPVARLALTESDLRSSDLETQIRSFVLTAAERRRAA